MKNSSITIKALIAILASSLFCINAEAQKKLNNNKVSANQPVKSSTPSIASSPRNNNIPTSSFGKGSFYLGGGASFAGSNLAVNASVEYGLTTDISVGGVVWLNTSGPLSIGVSGDYHLGRFFKIANLDPYIGSTVYYANDKITTVDENGNTSIKNGLVRVMAQAGVQYYVSPKVTAFAQYSVGLINGGNGYPTAGIKFAL